jgi:hypothetical protein
MQKEISISLLALSLAACGGDSSSDKGESENTNKTAPPEITIESYSSDSASSASPVGTWIAVYSGTHFIDNAQDSTYKGRELFTIKEQDDKYIITTCDEFIETPSINKADFLTTRSIDEATSNYSNKYTQTFTSNTNFTRTSTSTENVTGEGDEKNSVEKWVATTKAIKINDSIDITENISIASQNDDLSTDSIEVDCVSFEVNSKGYSTLRVENDDTDMVLENDWGKKEHLIYFSKNNALDQRASFEREAADAGVDISYDVTNDTADNYAVTANLSSPTYTGTFNVSIDFK